MTDVLWRAVGYVDNRQAVFDEAGEFSHYIDKSTAYVRVSFEKYPIVRRTQKGVWIDDFGHRRFILNDAKKRYAYPTKMEALESLYRRTKRRKIILQGQLKKARLLFDYLEGMENEDEHL